ncbi:hypothetical protein ACFS07_35970 [Undibacterium arcticum]
MKRLLVMVATAFFAFSNAMAGAIIGATEITQILNNFSVGGKLRRAGPANCDPNSAISSDASKLEANDPE